jgi:DNA-binding transcriptional MerR regulator
MVYIKIAADGSAIQRVHPLAGGLAGMQLKDLSEQSGVPAASIKFYLREGLLPAGEAIHATRAEYSFRHLERLRLIQALRRVVGLNIEQIRSLLRMADDGAPRLSLLAAVQRVVLKLDTAAAGSGGRGTQATDAVVHLRNWPDYPSDARNGLNAHLELMDSLDIEVTDEVLDIYSKAMDDVARYDIVATTTPESVDELILTAAVGMHMHSQLLLKVLALAQASHAIRRYEGDTSGTAAPQD